MFRAHFFRQFRIGQRSVRLPIRRAVLSYVALESRITPVILPPSPTAIFPIPATFANGVLSVTGNAQNNNIAISRNTAGTILVNGGAVVVVGGTPTVANTTLIQIFGQDGNDTITINEAGGTLPAAKLFGGNGHDVLTGGSGADQLFGDAGNDTLFGKGGIDLLFGGADNDVLTGGTGNDQVFGDDGNDRMIWNPGEGTDLNEGGAGADTVEVNGGAGAETFTLTPIGARVRFDRLSPGPFSLDIGTTENLILNANGGDDVFTGSNGLAPLIALTVDGGTGNDTITGGDGNDLLLGGDGNDVIIGGRGADIGLLGADDDSFIWNPGDGSDMVEGQAGTDTLVFNGAAANENITISANGPRLRFFRDLGNITMDCDGTEIVTFAALGGADNIVVDDLTGTAVTKVNLNLEGTPNSGTEDGQPDAVTVNGTNGDDQITVVGAGTSSAVTGLSATVNITASSGVDDSLVVNAGGGNDTFTATTLPAGVIRLTVDGGAGNDSLTGSAGADVIFGGADNDAINGRGGNDVAFMGAGDDTFTWNPGDGSDTIEGQDDFDVLAFNGSNASENIDIAANGGRSIFFRDVGNITMDMDDVERIDFNALAGADSIVVNDLSGTDVTAVNLSLFNSTNGPDGQVDSVTVNGTAAADVIFVQSSANDASVNGLSAAVSIVGHEALDKLTVNGQGDDDIVEASGVAADTLALTINGGAGADILIGGDGADFIVGGTGNDVAFMGAGDDTFTWNPGDGSDTVEGQAGNDLLIFNGSNATENIDISANGGRLIFFRDVGNISMDLDDIERLDFNALGGADNITVNDLSATDLVELNLRLSATLNGATGDGQVDSVVINGTGGNDTITVAGSAGTATIVGLSALITLTTSEAADRLTINAGEGNDVVDASALDAGVLSLTLNGEDGDDTLTGSAGDDTITGGAGDDTLIGGPGIDDLDGGTGNNILIP